MWILRCIGYRMAYSSLQKVQKFRLGLKTHFLVTALATLAYNPMDLDYYRLHDSPTNLITVTHCLKLIWLIKNCYSPL